MDTGITVISLHQVDTLTNNQAIHLLMETQGTHQRHHMTAALTDHTEEALVG